MDTKRLDRTNSLADIAALGEDVMVDALTWQSYALDGTSFAAPAISGIAAIWQEAALKTTGRKLTDEEFVDIPQESGTDVVHGSSNEPWLGESDAPGSLPHGYVVADTVAAVSYFLDNQENYLTVDPGLWVA